ncbi:uncharacterized protein znhit6 [Myxocyprinus asiaticus]|uniref:uncharacterized protein znhit6 n=1 Tax=Myxocyprinus asiaticus TaxID=70543 RepID=UPI00222240B0|nr:uncharacterized protein znhit6 [Myxocyprinus asiaticus]
MAKLMLNMLPVMDIDDKSGDEPRGVKRKIALSCCEVCGSEEAKYRCPNCMKHTCSLACVKRHKMLSGCRGVREKAAFVPLAQFNEIDMLNDYRFLEDTDRLRQRSNRDALLHASRQHPKEGKWMIRKARAAKVTLKLLPKIFSKHRENRTIFRKAEGRLHWHLKIHFPQSNAVYSERFPDNTQLIQILSGFIHPSASDPIKRQKLKVYVHMPQEDIRVFMKSEQTQPNSLRYLELDLKKSLGENLMYKTVVEYPELFVVLKRHSQEYLTRSLEHSNTAQRVADISRTSATKADPHSETFVHVAKRSKIISDDDELEDGEIQSEEDGSDKEHNGVNSDLKKTENKAPETYQDAGSHDDDEDHNSNEEDDSNEEERQGNQGHHDSLELDMEIKPKDPLPQDYTEDAELNGEVQNHVAAAINLKSRTEETTIVSHGFGDVCGQADTETLSRVVDSYHVSSSSGVDDSVQIHTREFDDSNLQCEGSQTIAVSPYDCQQYISRESPGDGCNKDSSYHNVDSHDQEGKAETHYGSCQASTAKSQGLSCPHTATCESEGQDNIHGSVGKGNANIDARDGHIHTDIHCEGSNQAYIPYSVGSGNASDGHISVDMCSDNASQANICDSMNGENAFVASDGHIPTDICCKSASQANISDQIGAENASVYASDCHVPTDIHSEGPSHANICDTVHGENANVYAIDGHIPADILCKGASKANLCDSLRADSTNVYALIPTHICNTDANHANICDTLGEECYQIHGKGAGKAIVCDSVGTVNANVYASEGHFHAEIPDEHAHQVNIGESMSAENANVYVGKGADI